MAMAMDGDGDGAAMAMARRGAGDNDGDGDGAARRDAARRWHGDGGPCQLRGGVYAIMQGPCHAI